MKDLSDYRREIDGIDRKLVALFEQRMGVSERIGEVKRNLKLPVKNKERENAVYRRWEESLQNQDLAPYLRELFECVMTVSCAYQEEVLGQREQKKAVYMGVPGSNGEAAALRYFAPEEIYGVDSFERVIESVQNGLVPFGLLPVENSTTGTVTDVLDLILSGQCRIVGETYVDVCHALLGVPGASESDITEIYSHEQGFSQCKEYLSKHPDWVRIPYYNTAVSAKFVAGSDDKSKAAIASLRAAEIYHLDVLNPSINTGNKNTTRFLLISATALTDENADKVSLAFTLPHVSGSLSRALEIFQGCGINLLKIESRPIVDRMGEYMFFIDFEGNLGEEHVSEALEELKKLSGSLKVFGNYRKGD